MFTLILSLGKFVSSGSRLIQSLLTITLILGSFALCVRAMEMGDDGPQVRELQQQLQNLGYFNLQPTGRFRELTRDAVIRFQQDQGLIPDGIVGAQTWSRLRSAGTRRPTLDNFPLLQRGDRGPQVMALQENLMAKGFFNGPITGLYGSLTEEAVRSYQRSAGLTPDGIYGRHTQARLEGGSPLGESLSSRSDPHVLELQRRLKARGFYDGPLDGILGPQTQEAISRAQQSYGISPEDIR
ncbi:peptidoglycan-binding protein [Roseofilum sp. BLCC_M91]|uniref:Peptidoglycan-binding protein n=1 Tax=Roseofilum halophilum BLCC-M91 TaxID=3022259 RepID=A0ABT7BEZ1_9CYAN|nr:peptidoglycan-binding protein [Roseofilum halophilum]MDJ1177747.1 peptidoglycan-binding protein [Roseofilum halophilum BLCC-M91]